MKAHDYYLERRFYDIGEDVTKYTYLVGKTIKAVSLQESFESELFEVVGFTTKENWTVVWAVLKSKESNVVITVRASDIGRTANNYFYNPSYELRIL